jgi:acetyl-CoA carboxylase biotin carboxyl carrier protein
MNPQNLTYEEIVSLISIFENSSEFNRLHLKYLDLELELVKKGAYPEVNRSSGRDLAADKTDQNSIGDEGNTRSIVLNSSDSNLNAFQNSQLDQSDSIHVGCVKVTSSMVGTFYASPEPGAEPFVSIGQRVQENTQVCIIEVMKLMSSIEAGVSGTVVDVLVKNNQPVEFGQVLFWIKPD